MSKLGGNTKNEQIILFLKDKCMLITHVSSNSRSYDILDHLKRSFKT